MSAYCSRRSPAALYFIEHQGLRSRYFPEVDRDSNSRTAVIALIRAGEVDPVKVLEVDESEGTVRDVTAEMIAEAGVMDLEPHVSALEAVWDWDCDHARALRNEVA